MEPRGNAQGNRRRGGKVVGGKQTTRETAIEKAGLPADVAKRLRRAGASTLEQVAELGVSGMAALRLSVGDLRRTFVVLATTGSRFERALAGSLNGLPLHLLLVCCAAIAT